MSSFFELYKNVHQYLVTETGNLNIFGKLLRALLILALVRILVAFVFKFLDGSNRLSKSLNKKDARRAHTLKQTAKNVIRALLYFYAALIILETFNVDTKSILATAGIGGLAIGFGAQSLVKDILSGFFILQEDSFVVGDHVEIKKYEGFVEDMTLRVTKIRDFDGDLHIIPNGEVQIITNRSKGALRALVIHSIAYEESIDKALDVLNQVCLDIKKEFKDDIISGPQIDGVENLTDVGVEIRITAMVDETLGKWAVERALRKQGKEALEAANIEIPYPRLVVFGREEE